MAEKQTGEDWSADGRQVCTVYAGGEEGGSVVLKIIYVAMVLVTYVVLVINIHKFYFGEPTPAEMIILAILAMLWPFYWARWIVSKVHSCIKQEGVRKHG